ncbi:putative gag-pol polyprotein, identical [Cucumis melo var. makuwa]|uniref:Gag-pol polyprotein, identical n=1 Tax=Cucumis melo var. makuwa TaxID=1194695 RepID=A0A5A7T7R1_CUCMM|nr:putative gag-pol polyprotein, identical [Cucumis melo var. makuwa]
MTRGQGRGGYHGRGRGTGKGCNRNEEQRQFRVQSSNKANIQCYHCKKFGHVKVDCWYKNQRANFAAENEALENNGRELNQGENLKVELENGKELQVEGKGTVGIETHDGNRILTNIQYMPDIGYNLLSVGQLMESGIQSCLMMVRA